MFSHASSLLAETSSYVELMALKRGPQGSFYGNKFLDTHMSVYIYRHRLSRSWYDYYTYKKKRSLLISFPTVSSTSPTRPCVPKLPSATPEFPGNLIASGSLRGRPHPTLLRSETACISDLLCFALHYEVLAPVKHASSHQDANNYIKAPLRLSSKKATPHTLTPNGSGIWQTPHRS